MCPKCGHCPTCGRSNYPVWPPYYPYVQPTLPYIQPTITWQYGGQAGTTAGGSLGVTNA